jgi:ubiquinol-cytochrome c reductase cytochrome c1 subunit
MSKTRIIPALLAAAIMAPGTALAAGGTHIENMSFSYEGPFGTYEKHQLQRGFQVFHEVCSACHGLKYLSFRDLGSETGPAFPVEQVKAIAALYEVVDDEGEPGDTRAGKAADKFPPNTGADAPDLSLMAKARAGFHGPYGLGINQLINGMGGGEYIFSILNGYHEEPECAADAEMEGSYNAAFAPGGYPDSCKTFADDGEGGKKEIGRMAPGSWIAMPPPLDEGLIEYAMHGGEGEGHGADAPEANVEQMAEDVSAFLMWAAEPQMTDRKKSGLRNILMLLVLTVLLYFTNKALWASVKRKE